MGRSDKPHELFSMRMDAGLYERLDRYVKKKQEIERKKGETLTTRTSVVEEALYQYLNRYDGTFKKTDTDFLIQIRDDIDKFLNL